MKGHIFVISAPSGTGKTTVIKELLKSVPELDLSVSTTTRPPRPQEKNGTDYDFVDEKKFKKMIGENKFVEWAEVHGRLYGTPKASVESCLVKGRDVLLDVDPQGAGTVKQKYPEAVLIFLLPPSFDELKRRLTGRGTDAPKDLEKRIENAREELIRRHEYDYQVVNENLQEAVQEISEIIGYCRGG